MDNEWPDIVSDEEDAILDEDTLLSGAELAEAEREAYAAIQAAADAAASAIANFTAALQRFGDAMRVIHDDLMLSETELS